MRIKEEINVINVFIALYITCESEMQSYACSGLAQCHDSQFVCGLKFCLRITKLQLVNVACCTKYCSNTAILQQISVFLLQPQYWFFISRSETIESIDKSTTDSVTYGRCSIGYSPSQKPLPLPRG